MLIPINDSVDVPLQNVKDAAKTLNHAITQFQDENYRQELFDVIKKAAHKDTSTKEDAQNYISQAMYLQSKCYTSLLSNNHTYLTADVCDMVAETQGTLKEWTVHDLPIEPNTSGTVLFEKPKFVKETKISTDDGSGSTRQHANIMGICWLYFTNQTIGEEPNTHQGDILWASLICNIQREDGSENKINYDFGGNEFAYEVHKDGTLHSFVENVQNGYYDKAIIDYFAATMMLMQQREIIAEPATYAPTAKRGKRRDPMLVPTGTDGEKTPFRISTVSLSETVRKAYAANSSSTGQRPTKSWWVKGHWRRQAHGPNRSLRKLIYIHPHISGNINAPLDDRKTMTKVVP